MKIDIKKALIVLILLTIVFITSCSREVCIEDVKRKIEATLLERYGEEFIVDGIGTRTANRDKFYQAKIYPVSIIGTEKEGDSYYYGSAIVYIEKNGKLSAVADTYGAVMMNQEAEDFLLPEINKIFGQRVLLNLDIKYKKKDNGSYLRAYVSGFEERLEEALNDSDIRLESEIYIYIFDRIDDEEEKEERRQQIFDFVQYLKEEGLFEYLEMGVIFIDERVLAPSYREYTRKIYRAPEEEVIVEGETVYLPPLELREEMSRILQEEVDQMREEELLASMGRIRKSELTPEQIANYNRQYLVWICSLNMLKETRSSRYNREKIEHNLDFYHYEDINNIIFAKDRKYIFE